MSENLALLMFTFFGKPNNLKILLTASTVFQNNIVRLKDSVT